MNILKTSQLPLVEFLRYINGGNEHHKYIMERKKSNCKQTSKWVTEHSPRPPTFYAKKEAKQDGPYIEDEKEKAVANLEKIQSMENYQFFSLHGADGSPSLSELRAANQSTF